MDPDGTEQAGACGWALNEGFKSDAISLREGQTWSRQGFLEPQSPLLPELFHRLAYRGRRWWWSTLINVLRYNERSLLTKTSC